MNGSVVSYKYVWDIDFYCSTFWHRAAYEIWWKSIKSRICWKWSFCFEKSEVGFKNVLWDDNLRNWSKSQ